MFLWQQRMYKQGGWLALLQPYLKGFELRCQISLYLSFEICKYSLQGASFIRLRVTLYKRIVIRLRYNLLRLVSDNKGFNLYIAIAFYRLLEANKIVYTITHNPLVLVGPPVLAK